MCFRANYELQITSLTPDCSHSWLNDNAKSQHYQSPPFPVEQRVRTAYYKLRQTRYLEPVSDNTPPNQEKFTKGQDVLSVSSVTGFVYEGM